MLGCVEDGQIPFQLRCDLGTPAVKINLFVLPATTVFLVPNTVDRHFRESNDAEQDGEIVE